MDMGFLEEGDTVKKVLGGGIHSAILSNGGKLYTFGCGSDGRMGHPEFEGQIYLYKESFPKLVKLYQGLRMYKVVIIIWSLLLKID